MDLDRRQFVGACSSLGFSGLFPGVLYSQVVDDEQDKITVDHVAVAEEMLGLSFTEDERELLVENLRQLLEEYESLREHTIPNDRSPAFTFDPRRGGAEIPSVRAEEDGLDVSLPEVERPDRDDDLAFASILEVAHLLKARKVTSVELTELALARLRRFDSDLSAVITYTEDRAMDAAEKADAELDAGTWRGPLHGVPYGAKDLFAVKGYKTTWGAKPYQDQHIDETASVIRRLDEAGAVLVAKLSLGALAWGDVWYGGTTRNPWNLDQGSSGSSAGPAAAVSAGCVPFSIGTETLGSIVSPCTRTGVTGHRPTFGTVSRVGAMTLSWTMDKVGPIARSVPDCAVVFDAIRGAAEEDPASVDMPFSYDPTVDGASLHVGYVKAAFQEDYDNQAADQETLRVLRDAGVKLEPVELPTDLPVGAMLNTLEVEAATAFDALTRSEDIDKLVRQGKETWPNVFRTSRFVPGVEYLQMNRLRVRLMERMHQVMAGFDAVVSPSFQGGVLQITNLTGHPCVCVPNALRSVEDGPAERRQPGSISIIGPLYGDASAMQVAAVIQENMDIHSRRPPLR